VPSRREGFTVRVLRSGSAAAAGVGFVVDEQHIVTCAHVVNTALGRDQRAQDAPNSAVRIGVDFPMLGDPEDAPMRGCRVEAWVPPPQAGISGGDVAGLTLIGGGLPSGAGPARLAEQPGRRDPAVEVFGYPNDPPRQDVGAWAALRLRGAVGGGLIQLDSSSESAIRAQLGYSGSPIVVQGDVDDEVVGMLAVASRGDSARDAYAIPVARLADAWPHVLGFLTIPECPYRGLQAFTADDADAGVFVGREEEITQLRQVVLKQALVMVTGPSGVGKSSLVNAGLVQVMRDEGWITRVFQPGGMPFDTLAETLFSVEQPGRTPTLDELARWADRLRSGRLATLGAQLSLAKRKSILLCVDQLEQVLDPGICLSAVSAGFLGLLLQAQSGDRLRVVCTLRADFLSQLLQHPDAGKHLRGGLFTLSPMGRDRLERVITEPAVVRGVQYESGLPPLIAQDAGDGGGLPLLGFALTKLWPHQRRRQITLAEYHSIGSVMGALSAYAERVYRELLEQFSEEQIRRVMLALIRSRGGASQATRRVVPRDRLGPDWVVAEALAEQRLVVAGHDSVDDEDNAQIAHEALIREWPRLAAWVDDDAEFQHWLNALEERAADGDLLPDTRLAEADRWLAERAEDIPDEVQRLVEASKSEWLRRVTELEDARNRAEQAAREAEARRLAAAAEFSLASEAVSLHIPIALAIESLGIAPIFEADLAIRHAIRIAARQVSRPDHSGRVYAVAFSPDGTRVATGGENWTARVFDAVTGAELSRLRHDGIVHAVAFSPDGTRVATGSWEQFGGSARVFDAATGAEVSRVHHDGTVQAVAFSADGTWVATGSDDRPGGSARVFDAATGAELSRLAYDGRVYAVAFSPDGTRVATSSDDRYGGSVRVFDAATGAELSGRHHGGVNAVAFSPDGTRVATGAGVFDSATGSELSRLRHDGTVCAVAFSPDGTRVATGSNDGSARVFDAATGAELSRLHHYGTVEAVAFSPDGTRVVTGSDFGSAVFDAAAGAELSRLRHDGAVYAVAFSPDGTRVATGAGVFDAATGTELSRLRHDGRVGTVAFSPDGTRVATGSDDGSARVFDAATGAELSRLRHDGAVYAVAFNPDGTRVATGARVFDAATGTELSRLRHDGRVYAVAFSPDGTRVATGAGVFDAATGAELSRLRHDGAVYAVAFSPDGTRVATGSDDGSARVFDAATGAELSRLHHDGAVGAVAFSPDGTRVATGSSMESVFFTEDGRRVTTTHGGSARVFDAATGAELSRLHHDGRVGAVAFSPDGTRIATGSDDGTARVFDTATGAELSRLHHDGAVYGVAFSPDGTRVATGSDDRNARVWVVDRSQLIEQAKGRLTENLSEREWQRFFGNEPHRKTRADLL
jgi:WD40 repeat protein